MRKLLFSFALFLFFYNQSKAQTQYLPLTGGTLSGSLSISGSTLTMQAPYYGINAPYTQPATSANVGMFANNNTTTLDIIGWGAGWRFVPSSASSYLAPVFTVTPNGNATFGNTTGLPAGGSAITIKGPNTPASSASYQDINYSFMSAGSARIRAYRGSSWDTYIDFLTNGISQGSDAPSVAMHIDQNGFVGIGTTAPQSNLHVEGQTFSRSVYVKPTSGNANLIVESGSGNAKWDLAVDNSTQSVCMYNVLNGFRPFTINYSAPTDALVVASSGNILIGQSSQVNGAYKLDVKGPARADKVVVNTNGADFVFDSTYDLKSLSEVENYVKQNKHLPEIETAAEMQKYGVDLGSNQTKLLQKVEELTLYLIEQNKKIEMFQDKQKKQEEQLQAQQQKIILLEKINKKQKKNFLSKSSEN